MIYYVECFDREIILFSKKSKSNITRFIKRSTARDFKISMEKVTFNASQEDPSEQEKENDREVHENAGKKHKR